ncbi:hypothetical protein E2C01_080261 [Portunus trituberculatus]|uniref:Uncharacterized protein n=1 Tax=Portunus trituberculatus TaxID=210409 RepID=A0A5B7ISY8_PORTR|nr:hypothetical protein [Portunus trituberculatus]
MVLKGLTLYDLVIVTVRQDKAKARVWWFRRPQYRCAGRDQVERTAKCSQVFLYCSNPSLRVLVSLVKEGR